MIATIGYFDGIHLGHQFLLRQVQNEAQKRGLRSAVVTFQQHPLQVVHPGFEPLLLTTPEEKAQLIRLLGIEQIIMLDFTHELSLLPAKEFMQKLRNEFGIQVLLIGYDHRFGHNREEGFEQYVAYGKELGIEVIQAKEFREKNNPVSSSIIRKSLIDGNIEKANRLLGYPFSIKGTVVEGHHMGRKLGFPTANLRMTSPNKIVPQNGVYAVRVWLNNDERTLYGMMSIGTRPTLQNGQDRSIEIHLFNFSEMIYGRQLAVEVIKRTRNERCFPSLDALKEQLSLDKQDIAALFEVDLSKNQ